MFEVINKTKQKVKGGNFNKIKKYCLGENYSLSLVFIGEKLSKKLNSEYRGKNKVANVLSFEIDKNNGEIFITPIKATKEAPKFNMSKEKFINFLFIHSILHLKGFEHGSKMEEEEKRIMKVLNL